FDDVLAYPRKDDVAATEVRDTPENLEIRVDLPGHDPKNIQVQIKEGVLSIHSERKESKDSREWSEVRYGRVHRSFTLPETADSERADAKFEHGVLTVSLPKKESSKPKTIDIRVAA